MSVKKSIVVAKGEYQEKCDCAVYPKQYVILKNDGKRYLSVRFMSTLSLPVTYIEFILFQLDVAGNVIKKNRIREDVSRTRANAPFAIPNGILLSERCVDFKIQPIRARCGRYVYSLECKEPPAVYPLDTKWRYKESFLRGEGSFSQVSKMKRSKTLLNFITILTLAAVSIISLLPFISWMINELLYQII